MAAYYSSSHVQKSKKVFNTKATLVKAYLNFKETY
jgi:hypothetical protein